EARGDALEEAVVPVGRPAAEPHDEEDGRPGSAHVVRDADAADGRGRGHLILAACLAAWPARSAAAAATTSTRSAAGLVVGLVDAQPASLQIRAVELLLRALGILCARHGDEGEPARLPGVAVE